MLSAAPDTVFSIPLTTLRADQVTGESDVGVGFIGSEKFVGDPANTALKFFLNIEQRENVPWPVVLAGASGTGKTALALSIASRVIQNQENPAAIFSASGFRRRFATAVDTNSCDQFHDSLASASLLFIDNLHLLSGFDTVQNQLTAVLDRFAEQEKPVLFTVNEKFLDPDCLSHRLVSRLSGGLCVNVHPPGSSAREKIVSDFSQRCSLELSDEAKLFLADELKLTYPKIRSILANLSNWLQSDVSNYQGGPVEKVLIAEYLDTRKQSNFKVVDFIIQEVADSFKLKPAEIKSSSRKQSIVMARGIAIYFLRNTLCISFSRIGEVFGGRDHSTIIHAENKISKLIKNQSTELIEKVDRIKRSIQEKGILDIGS